MSTNNRQATDKEVAKGSKDNDWIILDLKREIAEIKKDRDKQLATKDQQISNKDRQISNKDRQISNKDRQISNKDRQIDHLTKLIDQQQQLQLTTVAENKELKDNVQKLSGLLETSRSSQKRQANNKNDNLSSNHNPIHSKDKNVAVESSNKKEDIHKNKTSKCWWHFW